MFRKRLRHLLRRTSLRAGGATAVLALVAAFAAPPASALVIDNFEQGTFDVVAPAGGSASGGQVGLNAFNCISGMREVTVTSNSASQPAGAGLTLSVLDDEMNTVMPDGGGSVVLGYDIGAATDLTQGGTQDRIRVWVSVAPNGGGVDVGEVRVSIRDIGGTVETAGVTFGAAGNVNVFYSDFPSVDLANTERIDVALVAFDVGDYHVRDIRTIKVGQPLVVYNPIGTTAVAGPPYPTEPIRWDGSVEHVPGESMPAGTVEILVVSAEVDPTQPCDPYCDGVPYSLSTDVPPAPAPLAEAWLGFEMGAGPFPPEQQIAFEMTLRPPGAFMYGEVGSVGMWTSNGFLVELTGELFDGSGLPVAMTSHRLTGDVMDNGTLAITGMDAQLIPGAPPMVRISLGLADTGARSAAGAPGSSRAPSGEDPHAILGLRAESASSPPAVVVVPGAAPAAARLSATPSILRTHTTFDLGAAAARARGVEVYDAGGRRVRALTVPAGGRAVRWDGLTGGGARVGPGVYFVRLLGGRADAATRVVVMP